MKKTLAIAAVLVTSLFAVQDSPEQIAEKRRLYAELEAARADIKAAEVRITAAMESMIAPPPVVVEPPVVEAPWTHAFADMTVEQAVNAARQRVDPLLQSAPERVDTGFDAVYSELPAEIRNESRAGRWGKSYGATRQYNDEGRLIPREHDLLMDNVWLSGPWDAESTGAKWFVRMSNIPQARISRMRVVGSDLGGVNFPTEHAVYLDVSGAVSITDCLFENLGGHGVYLTNRAYDYEQYGFLSLPFTEKPSWFCDNVVVLNCEQDASKSAFNFTFYDPGSYEHPGDVVVRNCVSIQAWPFQRPQSLNDRHSVLPYRQGETRSSGGIVVTNYNPNHMGGEGWPTHSVVVDSSVIWTVQARHAALSLHGAEEYLIRDSLIRAEGPGGNHIIEIGGREGIKSFRGPTQVVIENNSAEGMQARIWLDFENFQIVELDSVGVRRTWTPEGITEVQLSK